MNTSPSSGSISFAITLSNVDFPHPLRPTKHILSPLLIYNSTPVNNGFNPKLKRTSLKAYIGASAVIFFLSVTVIKTKTSRLQDIYSDMIDC
jgi:hypothetical protein